MTKYRIIIDYKNHNYLAKVLALKKTWFFNYWSTVVRQAGPLRVIDPCVEKWCKEFGVDIKDVENKTIAS